MIPLTPSRLEAKDWEDMEKPAGEAPAEELEADEGEAYANHSNLIPSFSTSSTVAAVYPIPTLMAAGEDPIPTR